MKYNSIDNFQPKLPFCPQSAQYLLLSIFNKVRRNCSFRLAGSVEEAFLFIAKPEGRASVRVLLLAR